MPAPRTGAIQPTLASLARVRLRRRLADARRVVVAERSPTGSGVRSGQPGPRRTVADMAEPMDLPHSDPSARRGRPVHREPRRLVERVRPSLPGRLGASLASLTRNSSRSRRPTGRSLLGRRRSIATVSFARSAPPRRRSSSTSCVHSPLRRGTRRSLGTCRERDQRPSSNTCSCVGPGQARSSKEAAAGESTRTRSVRPSVAPSRRSPG